MVREEITEQRAERNRTSNRDSHLNKDSVEEYFFLLTKTDNISQEKIVLFDHLMVL